MLRTNVPQPVIAATTLICEGARVVGDVDIGPFSSVWFNAVLRADNGSIRIGECSNVQDNVVLHMSPGGHVLIGNFVTIGHQAVLHGCTVGNHCLIGMRSLVMNGAVIGANSIVAAGTIVRKGVYPANSLIEDSKVVRQTTEKDFERIRANALEYRTLTLRNLGLDALPLPGDVGAAHVAQEAIAA